MPKVSVSSFYCKGCMLCMSVCPKKILGFTKKINHKGYHYSHCIDNDQCIACKRCYNICPDVAIQIEK